MSRQDNGLEKAISRLSGAEGTIHLSEIEETPSKRQARSVETAEDSSEDISKEVLDKDSAPAVVEGDLEAGKAFELTDQTLVSFATHVSTALYVPRRELRYYMKAIIILSGVIIVLGACSSCVLLSFLDQTITATSLPTISSYFNSGKESTWVATAYLVASTAAQPLYGRFSDIFGRKVVLLGAVALFSVFSIACAVAQSMLQLIIFRGFKGLAGGGLFTMVMIVMADLLSLKDRGKFQGMIEGVIAISNGIGPVLGAVFSEKASWRWCFWINLPLCAIAAVLLVVFLPGKPTQGSMLAKFKAVDYGGCITSLASTVLLLIGLTWGGVTYPWKSAQVLVPICLAVVLFVVFLIIEGRIASHPIIPLRVFTNLTSAGVLAVTFLLGSAYYILLYYIPNFLVVVRGVTPIIASVILLPFVLCVTFVVEGAGLVVSKCGRYREFIIAGFAVWAASAGALSTLNETSSIGKIAGLLILSGVGGGLVVQTTVIAIMAAMPDRKDVAVAMSVRNYVRLLGGSIFLAVATTIVNNGLRSGLEGQLDAQLISDILDDPTAIRHSLRSRLSDEDFSLVLTTYTRSFRTLFLTVMGLLLAAFVITVVAVRHHSLTREEDKKLKEEGRQYMAERKRKKEEKSKKTGTS